MTDRSLGRNLDDLSNTNNGSTLNRSPIDGRGITNLTVVVRPTRRKYLPALVTVFLLDENNNLLANGFQNTYVFKIFNDTT